MTYSKSEKMKIQYEAIIQKDSDGNGTFCEIPFDVFKTFGKKRVKIKAIIDTVVYRGLLTPMGGEYGLFMNKEIREKIGKNIGDMVQISIEEDTEPRIVDVPADLLEAMQAADVKDFFDSLSFTHQKEYAVWITEAKKAETRQNRILKAIEMMKNKVRGK